MSVPRVVVVGLGLGVVIATVAAGTSIQLSRMVNGEARSTASQTAALPLTLPSATGQAFVGLRADVASQFQPYYSAQQGAALLGPAVTPALPVSGGWVQFYTQGALFLPDLALKGRLHRLPVGGDADAESSRMSQLIAAGSADGASGVVRLPLLQALLAAGSEVPIGGPGSRITYADLRRAAQPEGRVAAPAWYRASAPGGPSGTFIPEERRGQETFGHVIPASVWTALGESAVSPRGWQRDFGRPVTEALITTITRDGATHKLTIQMFERGAIMLDAPMSARGGNAAPVASQLAVGVAYLQTFGPPSVRVMGGTHAWISQAVAAHGDANEASPVIAHLGTNLHVTLTPETMWVNGRLWYEASWQVRSTRDTGWVPASDVSFKPLDGPAHAGLDALDHTLGAYLNGLGYHAGVAIYDLTRGAYYSYNAESSFIVASSVKVPIMLALLTQIEQQGRELNDNEMYLLTTMIENSNNDSAQLLYEEVGDAPGLTAFMHAVGVGGLQATPGAWGWSTITPNAMVALLTMLQEGKVLNGAHRALALNLMEHVESDQVTGVGDTAPAGARVAVKDGWVQGPDGMWVMNSSGIVTIGAETYIISVYTTDDDDLGMGWDVTRHVCDSVGSLLR